VANSTKLFPTHCNVPSFSQNEETIIAATDLVKEFGGIVPPRAKKKEQYAKQLQKLTVIIANKPLLRVANTPVTRMDTPTTSNDSNLSAPKAMTYSPQEDNEQHTNDHHSGGGGDNLRRRQRNNAG